MGVRSGNGLRFSSGHPHDSACAPWGFWAGHDGELGLKRIDAIWARWSGPLRKLAEKIEPIVFVAAGPRLMRFLSVWHDAFADLPQCFVVDH